MFTKLHNTIHEYGGKRKFGAKNEELVTAVNSKMWNFFQLTAKLRNNWMKELY